MAQKIPIENHITRYCGSKKLTEDKKRVLPTAFYLDHDKNETYISVNCLELLSTGSKEESIAKLREVFRNKLYDLRPKARFAVLNVETATEAVDSKTDPEVRITVEHFPEKEDKSHCGICGISEMAENVQMLVSQILANAVQGLFPARTN